MSENGSDPNDAVPSNDDEKDEVSEKLLNFFKNHVPPMAPDLPPLPPTADEFLEMFDEEGNLKPEYRQE